MFVRQPIALLFIDDSESDMKLATRELRRGGFAPERRRVTRVEKLRACLAERSWDIVLGEPSAAHIDIRDAMATVREVAPGTPFVVLAKRRDDDVALETLRCGAVDFVLKAHIGRLPAVIARECRRPLGAEQTTVTRLLLAAQEAESRRVARELHARVGQLLSALAHTLAVAQHEMPPECIERIDLARQLAEQAIRSTRELSTELWPCILDDVGLAPALRWLGDRYSQRFGFSVAVNGDDVPVIPKVPAAACYRITEEALSNVARHAAARRVEIAVRARRLAIEVEIRDDGRGCAPDLVMPRSVRGESLGLAAMKERAVWAGGTFVFDSKPGGGTTVSARIPIRGI